MKLIRFGDPGKEHPGLLLNDGTRVDVSEFSPNGLDYDEAFFSNDGIARLRMGRPSPVLDAACATVRAFGASDRAAEQDRMHWPQLSRSCRRKQDGNSQRAGDFLQVHYVSGRFQ